MPRRRRSSEYRTVRTPDRRSCKPIHEKLLGAVFFLILVVCGAAPRGCICRAPAYSAPVRNSSWTSPGTGTRAIGDKLVEMRRARPVDVSARRRMSAGDRPGRKSGSANQTRRRHSGCAGEVFVLPVTIPAAHDPRDVEDRRVERARAGGRLRQGRQKCCPDTGARPGRARSRGLLVPGDIPAVTAHRCAAAGAADDRRIRSGAVAGPA